MMQDSRRRGFTLIEVLIVVAAVGLLAGVVVGFSFGARAKKDLLLTTQSVAATLRDAQQRSITQLASKKWGVRLETLSTGDRYQVFADAYSAASVSSTRSIFGNVVFDATGWGGTTRDIVFTKIYGLPEGAASDIVITLRVKNTSDAANAKTITISKDSGTITY